MEYLSIISQKEKGCAICHIKRRSISTDFVLIPTLNSNWYLLMDHIVNCLLLHSQESNPYLQKHYTVHIIFIHVFYSFVNFSIFGVIFCCRLLCSRFDAKLLGKIIQRRREFKSVLSIQNTKCICMLHWTEYSKVQPQFLPRVVKFRFWKREGKAPPIFLPFFTTDPISPGHSRVSALAS